MKKNKSVLISLSGGLDSAVLCGRYINRNYKVTAVNFQYGSKHNPLELSSFLKLVNHYNLQAVEINLPFFAHFKSNLLEGQGEIPFGHYQSSSMKQTVVPARNLIFISILAGLAESLNIDKIALAVHAGDHFIYPDCRPLFIHEVMGTVLAATDSKVEVEAPFLYLNKAEIVHIGSRLNVPFELTRTCYTKNKKPCGKCGACVERAEAFKYLNLTDPLFNKR